MNSDYIGQTCEFCGKDREPVRKEIAGKVHTLGYLPCTCQEAREDRVRRLEAECAREAKVRHDRLSAAGIPERYVDAIPQDGWRCGAWIYGETGTGKTHLAASMAAWAVDEGVQGVAFTKFSTVLGEIGGAYNSGTSPQSVVRRYARAPLLILDDLGKETPTEKAVSRLYELLDARYDAKLPTVCTCNYTLPQFGQRLAAVNEDASRAIVSRLSEMCPRVFLGGEDRRLHGHP